MTVPKKTSIAIFLNAFWVHSQGMSGGDQMAIQIFSRIRQAFTDLFWFTNPDGEQAARKIVHDVTFSVTPAFIDRFPIGLSYILRTVLATIRLFGKRVDIVYSGSDFFPDVLPAYLYTRLYRNTRWVQCVFHLYPHWRSRPGNKLINWLAAGLQNFSLTLARRAEGIVNINQQVREELITRGFEASRLVVITPGIDLDFIASVPPSEISEDSFNAVFLGRLNYSKGIFDLPEIWRIVVANQPDARLAIIGGGSDEVRKKLQTAITNAGVERNITLLGFVDSSRIYAILKSARVFVFPSHEEGFGIAVVEAMACGLPVVAWNLPVFDELFGDAVTMVPRGDYEAFAERVTHFFHTEPTLAKCDVAKKTAHRYGWKSICESMKCWLLDNIPESCK